MSIDYARLPELRLIIARVGEMDAFRRWTTRGQLGLMGAMALCRGLPRSHRFPQIRSVFAGAVQRCAWQAAAQIAPTARASQRWRHRAERWWRPAAPARREVATAARPSLGPLAFRVDAITCRRCRTDRATWSLACLFAEDWGGPDRLPVDYQAALVRWSAMGVDREFTKFRCQAGNVLVLSVDPETHDV